MALTEFQQKATHWIVEAAQSGKLAAVEVTRKSDGKKEAMLAIVMTDDEAGSDKGGVRMYPMALLMTPTEVHAQYLPPEGAVPQTADNQSIN